MPTQPVTNAPAPLQLATEPRLERYEITAPGGTIVEVTHNIDTGDSNYSWTNRNELAHLPGHKHSRQGWGITSDYGMHGDRRQALSVFGEAESNRPIGSCCEPS